MHEKYTWILNVTLIILTLISTYLSKYFLFIYLLFYFYLINVVLSGYIIVSCYYSVSSYIFRAWLHEVIPNSNLYYDQLKRSQTKQVFKSHIVCNYVPKENSNGAFPKSRCCSVIILSCFKLLIPSLSFVSLNIRVLSDLHCFPFVTVWKWLCLLHFVLMS